MSDETRVTPEGRPVPLWPLWLGILGPPAAWALQLLVSYSPVEMLCDPASSGREVAGVSLNALAIISTLVAAAATIACGAISNRARRAAIVARDEAGERSVFMAWFGILSSVYFLVVIVVGALGPLAIPGCR